MTSAAINVLDLMSFLSNVDMLMYINTFTAFSDIRFKNQLQLMPFNIIIRRFMKRSERERY